MVNVVDMKDNASWETECAQQLKEHGAVGLVLDQADGDFKPEWAEIIFRQSRHVFNGLESGIINPERYGHKNHMGYMRFIAHQKEGVYSCDSGHRLFVTMEDNIEHDPKRSKDGFKAGFFKFDEQVSDEDQRSYMQYEDREKFRKALIDYYKYIKNSIYKKVLSALENDLNLKEGELDHTQDESYFYGITGYHPMTPELIDDLFNNEHLYVKDEDTIMMMREHCDVPILSALLYLNNRSKCLQLGSEGKLNSMEYF